MATVRTNMTAIAMNATPPSFPAFTPLVQDERSVSGRLAAARRAAPVRGFRGLKLSVS